MARRQHRFNSIFAPWLIAIIATACMMVCLEAKSEWFGTNTSRQIDDIFLGTKERCFATQKDTWAKYAVDFGPVTVAQMTNANPPTIVYTELGAFTNDLTYPGFFKFDPLAVVTFTQDLITVGADLAKLQSGLGVAAGFGIWFFVATGKYADIYDVPPPQNITEKRTFVGYQVDSVVTLDNGNVVTNISPVFETVTDTLITPKAPKWSEIAAVDESLYKLLGYYGYPLDEGGSNYFYTFSSPTNAYGFTVDTGAGISNASASLVWSNVFGFDNGSGFFSRDTEMTMTNTIMAQLVLTITNVVESGGDTTYETDWILTDISELVFEGFIFGFEDRAGPIIVSFTPDGLVTSTTYNLTSVNPQILYKSDNTNAISVTIDIAGDILVAKLDKTSDEWGIESFTTNEFPLTSSSTEIFMPFADITSFSCTNFVGTFINDALPIQVGDIIMVAWETIPQRYGRLPMMLSTNDLWERRTVLTNMRYIAHHQTTLDNRNGETPVYTNVHLYDAQVATNYFDAQTVTYAGTTPQGYLRGNSEDVIPFLPIWDELPGRWNFVRLTSATNLDWFLDSVQMFSRVDIGDPKESGDGGEGFDTWGGVPRRFVTWAKSGPGKKIPFAYGDHVVPDASAFQNGQGTEFSTGGVYYISETNVVGAGDLVSSSHMTNWAGWLHSSNDVPLVWPTITNFAVVSNYSEGFVILETPVVAYYFFERATN